MARTLNSQALDFANRYLFLAEPNDGFVVPSVSVREVASAWCEAQGCGSPCRLHSQAMMVGVSKAIVTGDIHAEVSFRGVVFVRLSPAGVMQFGDRESPPDFWFERPELVEWAERKSGG